MSLNYNNKFKDRNPLDTIKIIQNFFNSKGFELKTVVLEQENSGTWTSRIELHYNGKMMFGQNGKGVTKEYCLASGYGELYERYCNKIFCINNTPLMNKILDKNKALKGYYFHPKEKRISFKELFNTSAIGTLFEDVYNKKNDLENYFNTIYNQRFIGVPFKNVYNENDIIYADPRIVSYLTSSTGMAAGNTFYEAYIQAMSEFYEHVVKRRLYAEEKDEYYYIDLNSIKNSTIQEIIKNIQKENDLYIFDLSYNFNVPVLMSVIVTKKTHAITINMGSAPVLDIAIERILTELYQGHKSFELIRKEGQFPSLSLDTDFKLNNYLWEGTLSAIPFFPEFIIKKMKKVSNFNTSIFLQGDYNNFDLYKYLKIINNNNNFNIYYLNTSKCEEMYSIKLFETNSSFNMMHFELVNEINDVGNMLNWSIDLYNFVNNYLNYQEFALDKLVNLFNRLYNFSDKERVFLIHLLFDNWFLWTASNSIITYRMITLCKQIINDKKLFYTIQKFLEYFSSNPFVYEEINKYSTLTRYFNSLDKYKLDDIILILNFLKIDCTIEDIKNLKNDEYWIKKIIFADINHYFDGYYDNYIEILADY